jgi:hypothetical protein
MKLLAILLLAAAALAPAELGQDASSDIVAAAAAARAKRATAGSTSSRSIEMQAGGDSQMAELVEAMGLREGITQQLKEVLEKAHSSVREQCPQCDPRLVQEYYRRMEQELSVDKMLYVTKTVFSCYLAPEDVSAMLEQHRRAQAGQPVQDSPQLARKFESAMPSIKDDLKSEFMRIASETSARVLKEIAREHPEYSRPAQR